MVQFLVQQKASVHGRNAMTLTPLNIACKLQHMDIAKFLVLQGGVGDSSNSSSASFQQNNSASRDLVQDSADLVLAVLAGDLQKTQFFINSCGVSVDTKNLRGCSMLQIAIQNNFLDISKFLVRRRAALETGLALTLMVQVAMDNKSDDVDFMNLMIDNGFEYNDVPTYPLSARMDQSILCSSIHAGTKCITAMLLAKKYINLSDCQGRSHPLHLAAQSGDLALIRYCVFFLSFFFFFLMCANVALCGCVCASLFPACDACAVSDVCLRVL